jgi:nitroimidazol reductase NimA-like FMN-containing flavoprotein (pyridoxamine 5'-phosphate oxidase superfamily)
VTVARSGDFARRVAHRRQELGLTCAEVARRAEMDPGYLDYLEHSSIGNMPPGPLMRLAAALETTADSLSGGTMDRPPGPGRAGPYPRLDSLSREQCEAHLAGGGVGRLVFLAEGGPLALPVNFRFAEGDVVFRTSATGALAAAVGETVSFEVDHIDEAMSEGWSVLITGRARLVNDRAELQQLARLGIEPWPGGKRDAVIRIEAAEISGRRIRQQDSARSSARPASTSEAVQWQPRRL